MNNVETDKTEGALVIVSQQQYDLVKRTIAKDCNDDEMNLYLHYCKTKKVHPLDQMIIPTIYNKDDPSKRKMAFISTIDFFRSQAEDSGEYDGQDEPVFEGEIEVAKGNVMIKVPEICRVNIYRKGIDRPFVGVARWTEYCPTGNRAFKWLDMSHVMLGKCSEVNGFRKAFPRKFEKTYIPEEMMQASDTVEITDVSDVQPPKKGKPAGKKASTAATTGASGDQRERLAWLIRSYCNGNKENMKKTLKDVSKFGEGKDQKYIRDLSKASDKWVAKSLGRMMAHLKTLNCTADPTTCTKGAFENDKATCISDDGVEPCRFALKGE